MSLLDSIQSSRKGKPRRIIIYGEHAVGKSSWAASAPSPIFIQTEDGLGDIEAPAFPLCKSWDDVLEQLRALYKEKHDYKTVVVDSLDWAEPLNHRKVCASENKESIADFAWGKGYEKAMQNWEHFLSALDHLREKGMTIILIAHSKVERFESPDLEPYDRYNLALHKKATAAFCEWADEIFFATFKVHLKTSQASNNKKAIGGKERIFFTENRATHTAKHRLPELPFELPIVKGNGWESYAKYFDTKGDK